MGVSRTINEYIQQEEVSKQEKVTENAQLGDFFASTVCARGTII